MGNLTKNIWRHEIACKCGCGENTIDFQVVEMWQDACNYFAYELGIPKVVLVINSGVRCAKHNKQEGGGIASQHLKGKAIDGKIVGVPPQDLYDYFDDTYPDSFGLGSYDTFTHADSRTEKARW